MTQPTELGDLKDLVALCKRRGFVFPSSEIYGGINSCWDYGPLGAQLKMQVKRRWWDAMTRRTDVEGLDSAILMHPMVWEASGHVAGFSDPLVDCKSCKSRFRADKIPDATVCPNCRGELTEPRNFNLMFKTFLGPLEDSANLIYLRPETAQGIYVNFLNVQQTSRQKIPFGIAQIGKAFRNEITPGNFIFRTREFEQMEMQYFVHPTQDEKWFNDWKQWRLNWHIENGIRPHKLRYHQHTGSELAHYAKAAFDIEYEFPFGWQEIEGIHNRSDFDLSQHAKFSKKRLDYFDESTQQHYLPYIIETSAGCDRSVLMLLCDAYRKDADREWLSLNPMFAPIQMAIFPLLKKPELTALAQRLLEELSRNWRTNYDEVGSIGKRYRRQDEVGTPFCLTVDPESLTDHQVTVRFRDSMQQERIAIDQVTAFFANQFTVKSAEGLNPKK
jgi:glycyl-tRNA synthetase